MANRFISSVNSASEKMTTTVLLICHPFLTCMSYAFDLYWYFYCGGPGGDFLDEN